MVFSMLINLKRVISLKPEVKVPNAILMMNATIVAVLIFFCFVQSKPSVNVLDVSVNLTDIAIQLLLLASCWRNSQ